MILQSGLNRLLKLYQERIRMDVVYACDNSNNNNFINN